MKTSETIGKIAEALAKAQESMHNATKSSSNPYFNSKYADLAEVLSVCRPELSKNGIAIIQSASTGEGYCVNVTTRLAHGSGEWIESTLTLMGEKLGKDGKPVLNQQSIGSAITYARRFTLSAIVGIAQEDDDGNASAGNFPKNTQPKKTQAKKLTKEESQKLKEEIIKKFEKAETLEDLAVFKNELKPKIMRLLKEDLDEVGGKYKGFAAEMPSKPDPDKIDENQVLNNFAEELAKVKTEEELGVLYQEYEDMAKQLSPGKVELFEGFYQGKLEHIRKGK